MAVNIPQLVGLGVLGLGVILHIVGTATPAWIIADVDTDYSGYVLYGDGYDTVYEQGLFKTCDGVDCYDTPETEWIRTVKALTLSGVVLSLLAGLLAVVVIVQRSKNRNLSRVPSVICLLLCLLAGLLIIIGVIIFWIEGSFQPEGLTNYRSKSKLGYSFGLCITGGILIIIGGAMASAVCQETPNNNQSMGTTAVVPGPPMMYPPQAGGMMYQPQAGGVVYQPQAGAMVYQPQAGAMVYQPQAGGMAYQPQAGGMVYQPQAGAMVYQTQAGGMAYPSATMKENDDAKYTPGTDASETKGKE